MRSQQSGFTLVEIAIVLVIIGLLLGGILKGQELINSAKVKNLANDFRVIPTYVYAYQDKYRALPGDHQNVAAAIPGATAGTGGTLGNGVIEGAWNATESGTTESNVFWQHIRLANLAAGPTTLAAGFAPTNSVGGRLGIQSGPFIDPTGATAMRGTYSVCSAGILGRFVKQLDIQMDDGVTNTGSMRAAKGADTTSDTAIDAAEEGEAYTVCMMF